MASLTHNAGRTSSLETGIVLNVVYDYDDYILDLVIL